MTENPECFLIFVTVIEGRHFAILNMDSIVHIRIGKQKKNTGVQKATDCPYFNEYFVFEFTTTLSQLLDLQMVLTVIQPQKCWRKRKLIGSFKLDVATIWAQSEHQFYHKWVIMSAGFNEKKPGTKGYLKIDVGILTKGKVPHFPVSGEDCDDEIEGNLLLPENVTHDRYRANYSFFIYSGDEIPKIKNFGYKRLVDSEQFPSTYVQITFAGLIGRTAVKKSTQNPVWAEKIVFTELFPSLCQRIKIELRYTQHIHPVVHYIYLKAICNEGENNGFLPIFGPSYIYLYNFERGEVNYNGKLLLEMKTEIQTDLMWSANAVEVIPIRQLPNLRLWKIEPILLVCNIYSVTMIDNKYKDKQISFEISMGGPPVENATALAENTSKPVRPVSESKNSYWYLPYRDKKTDLEEVERLFEKNYKDNKDEINHIHTQIAQKLENNSRIFLNMAQRHAPSKIELEEKKLQIYIKEMRDIEANIAKMVSQYSRKKVFRRLLKHLCTLHDLIDDVENCWPDIFIWMLAGNNRIGYYRVHAKDIIYSSNVEETGLQCGIIQNIDMKPINKSKFKQTFGQHSAVLCRVRMQMWIGLNKEKDEYLHTVDDCFFPIETSEVYDIPTEFISLDKRYATCKVYIYQGRYEPGADRSGLSDPFVQVIFNEHVLKTKAIHETIHPIWNQSLIFNNVVLYGTTEFLTANMPALILESYDYDMLAQNEFIGRSEFVPIVCTPGDDSNLILKWIKVHNGDKIAGEILMAAEIYLTEPTEDLDTSVVNTTTDSIPDSIMPDIRSYKLDVYFWGVHDLKPLCLCAISKPKITIECGGTTLHSTTLQNTKKYLNFHKPYQSVNVNIPENEEYYPPLSITMFDCRGFGWHIYVGTYLGKLQDHTFTPLTINERNQQLNQVPQSASITESSSDTTDKTIKELHINKNFKRDDSDFDIKKFKLANQLLYHKMKYKFAQKFKKSSSSIILDDNIHSIDLDTMDWWTKFYLSTEKADIYKDDPLREKLMMTIYPCELESIPEFNNFNDLLHTFKLYRGKRTGDEILDEENIIGIFKGAIRLYQWPLEGAEGYVTETGYPLQDGAFQHYPVNEPVSFLARVYVVRAFNLRPKDASGKSDPYLIIRVGDKEINDSSNYFPNNVNPVFGRCFEFKGIFPNDNMLTISVWDWDLSSPDDLIGETKIDLENRLYTNHRGNCGLPNTYIEYGPCAWRDQYKPSQILTILCQRNKLGEPVYFHNSIKVGPLLFTELEEVHDDEEVQKEILSLLALNRWKEIPLVGCPLVPEHVETRSLYHYSKPGLEQGKLQIWVDVFPSGDFPPPPAVDITPRAPQPFELRIIVWNTDDVILSEDDFFVGEKKSDIYVKAWLTDTTEAQCTDVHYNSISGEGNFNWRFIFKFFYLAAEDKIVVRKKDSFFSDLTEYKLPCFLHLQVWDNDTFSADDFLGSLKLSLSHLARGAKTSKLCTLNILKPGAPTVNLFKTKRHKGWWPFLGREDDTHHDIIAGKVEMEMQLLTETEFILSPAGIARTEPQPLPVPKRPDMSFSWLRNPLRALKILICRRFRMHFIIFLVTAILIFVAFVAIYSFPNYLIKKILGA